MDDVLCSVCAIVDPLDQVNRGTARDSIGLHYTAHGAKDLQTTAVQNQAIVSPSASTLF